MKNFNYVGSKEELKNLGVKYVCGVAQPMFDSVWLLGCSNLPNPLPRNFTPIKDGYKPYLEHIKPDMVDLFKKKMLEINYEGTTHE